MYLDPRNTSYGFRVESPNAHDSKFMIGFVPSAQHAENAEIPEAKMEAGISSLFVIYFLALNI